MRMERAILGRFSISIVTALRPHLGDLRKPIPIGMSTAPNPSGRGARVCGRLHV